MNHQRRSEIDREIKVKEREERQRTIRRNLIVDPWLSQAEIGDPLIDQNHKCNERIREKEEDEQV